jgi:hypothetical protein
VVECLCSVDPLLQISLIRSGESRADLTGGSECAWVVWKARGLSGHCMRSGLLRSFPRFPIKYENCLSGTWFQGLSPGLSADGWYLRR